MTVGCCASRRPTGDDQGRGVAGAGMAHLTRDNTPTLTDRPPRAAFFMFGGLDGLHPLAGAHRLAGGAWA